MASVQPQVANHYNQIKQKTREQRQQSNILGVRRFNNWIKSVLIHRYAGANATVLDLCCGKGGDLMKFVKAGVRSYVGADHAIVSLQDAVRRYNEITPLPFPATFICADCHSTRLSRGLPPMCPPFDLVSCQFALHYSFETEARARMFACNIGERLKPGGFFVATFPNSNVLQRRLKQAIEKQKQQQAAADANAMADVATSGESTAGAAPTKLEFGNSVYRVRFTEPCPFIERAAPTSAASVDAALPPLPPLPASPFGVQYVFDLSEAISDCPEYLVHMPTLCSLLGEYDMELVQSSSLHQFFVEHSAHPEYGRLMKQMKVMGNDYDRGITPDEWEVLSKSTNARAIPPLLVLSVPDSDAVCSLTTCFQMSTSRSSSVVAWWTSFRAPSSTSTSLRQHRPPLPSIMRFRLKQPAPAPARKRPPHRSHRGCRISDSCNGAIPTHAQPQGVLLHSTAQHRHWQRALARTSQILAFRIQSVAIVLEI
jgi:mRNA (guanine-N7-)-methyltransferase